LVFSFFTVP